NRVSQKFLTAVLNSTIIAFWLKHRGKMQGLQYQVDKAPLLELPLVTTTDTARFENLVDHILFLKEHHGSKEEIQHFENALNESVYQLYFGNKNVSKINLPGDYISR